MINIFSNISPSLSRNSKIGLVSTDGSIKAASIVSGHHIKYDKFLSYPPIKDLTFIISLELS